MTSPMTACAAVLFCCAGWNSAASAASPDDPPNILWISCEDISPNLGCYGDPHAVTPHLDRLAAEGARFTRAFTPSGVGAVVRSGVITGVYPAAIGAQHTPSQIVPPPEVRCFSEYLRGAGYFCTNRGRTDYQFDAPQSAWDRQGEDHTDWRERRDPEQPFFAVVNLTVTHESQLRQDDATHAQLIEAIGKDNAHDPDHVVDTMPPYLADTPATRRNWARYQDQITRLDQLVGQLLQRLDDDALTDSTLVVFWSDHGMGLPRGKRWLYDSGTRIPMLIRWPGRVDAGSQRQDLVSVLDLPATTLAAAGVAVPRYMHGRVLLGNTAGDEPPYLFFHRDRIGETRDLQRAARDRRWKYIRNYEPHRPYSQHNEEMDALPAMQDWRRLAAEGILVSTQKLWFAATKPIEELYDTDSDPWELNNLADVPQYAERLARMRAATESWQQRVGDRGMVPEAVMMQEMRPGGQWQQTAEPQLERRAGEVWIHCVTEGASIVYRSGREGQWSDWMYYARSVPLPTNLTVQAQSHRLGYRPSSVATLRPQ